MNAVLTYYNTAIKRLKHKYKLEKLQFQLACYFLQSILVITSFNVIVVTATTMTSLKEKAGTNLYESIQIYFLILFVTYFCSILYLGTSKLILDVSINFYVR